MPSPDGAGYRPRILHVHPTRRCNLRCLHCYSSSGPDAVGALDEGYLFPLVEDAAAMGYRSMSVSGGEPLLYPALPRLLHRARDAGMEALVVTNGTVFGGGRLDAVAEHVDVLAVSLDGPPDLHNAIRGDRGSFDRVVAGLEQACAAAPRVGVVYSLSAGSWDWLPEAASLALDAGAAFLHLHPLEATGRATLELADALPDDHVLLNAYVVAGLLRAEMAGRLVVNVDLVHREHMVQSPETFYAGEQVGDPREDPAGAVGTLVVEDDGAVVPIAYGMDRRHAVGSAEVIETHGLRAAWESFADHGLPDLRHRCRAVVDRLLASSSKVFNWGEAVADPGFAPAAPGEGRGLGR